MKIIIPTKNLLREERAVYRVDRDYVLYSFLGFDSSGAVNCQVHRSVNTKVIGHDYYMPEGGHDLLGYWIDVDSFNYIKDTLFRS